MAETLRITPEGATRALDAIAKRVDSAVPVQGPTAAIDVGIAAGFFATCQHADDADLSVRLSRYARALNALAHAVKGCGASSGGFACGELPKRSTGPRMCSECARKVWAAIATLTAPGGASNP